MSVKYTYSVATDTLNGIVNTSALESEILASSITVVNDQTDVFGDTLDIWFKTSLSAGEQTTLTGVVNTHTGAALSSPMEVLPVNRKTDKLHRIVSNKVATTAGEAKAQFKVPTGDRWLKSIWAWFTTFHNEDTIKIEVIDEDNILGGGAGALVSTQTGSTVAGYQKAGWYIDPADKKIEFSVFGGPEKIQAGLYLTITGTKGDASADTLFVTVGWGEEV